MIEHMDLETEPNFLSASANKAIPRLLALLRIEPSTNPSAMAVGCSPHFEELLLLRTIEGRNTQNVLTKTRSLINKGSLRVARGEMTSQSIRVK